MLHQCGFWPYSKLGQAGMAYQEQILSLCPFAFLSVSFCPFLPLSVFPLCPSLSLSVSLSFSVPQTICLCPSVFLSPLSLFAFPCLSLSALFLFISRCLSQFVCSLSLYPSMTICLSRLHCQPELVGAYQQSTQVFSLSKRIFQLLMSLVVTRYLWLILSSNI